MNISDLSSVLSLYFPDCLRGVERPTLGAIISVEPFKADPKEPLENWRLDPTLAAGISRHFTEVFYAHPLWKEAKQGQTDDAAVQHVVNQRLSAFADTLAYADRFLKSPENGDKKLVVHSVCSKNYAPAIMLGILSDQFPSASPMDVITATRFANHSFTKLENNELAFIDAATKRGGNLIRAWDESSKRFSHSVPPIDVDEALHLHDNYRRIITAREAKKRVLPALLAHHDNSIRVSPDMLPPHSRNLTTPHPPVPWLRVRLPPQPVISC